MKFTADSWKSLTLSDQSLTQIDQFDVLLGVKSLK